MSVFGIGLIVFIVFFSVILHEISHGFVALLFGDRTAKDANRLTLNPLPHIDLVGTIILPAFMVFIGGPIFGWAKPVPVDVSNLRPRKIGTICVSLAGITTNFLLAFAAAMIFRLVKPDPNSLAAGVLFTVIMINLILGVFNLMPIPPLDGSQLWMMWMPDKIVYWMQQRMMFWFLALFLILPRLPIGNIVGVLLRWLIGAKTT